MRMKNPQRRVQLVDFLVGRIPSVLDTIDHEKGTTS